jgi:hypothetical protein
MDGEGHAKRFCGACARVAPVVSRWPRVSFGNDVGHYGKSTIEGDFWDQAIFQLRWKVTVH